MTTEGDSESRRPTRDERRQALLDSAVDGIRIIGSGASMEELASHGGVTKPILYRHFGNRDGLVQAVGEQWAARLLTELGAGFQADTGKDLLWLTVHNYLGFLEADPELYMFLMRQTTVRDDSQMTNAVVGVIASQIAVVIAERFEDRGRNTAGAEPWAYGIIGMVQSAGDWWLKHADMTRDDLTRHLTDLLWNGFFGMVNLGPESTRTSDPTA